MPPSTGVDASPSRALPYLSLACHVVDWALAAPRKPWQISPKIGPVLTEAPGPGQGTGGAEGRPSDGGPAPLRRVLPRAGKTNYGLPP